MPSRYKPTVTVHAGITDPGGYAAPYPGNDRITTYWLVDGRGQMHDYPEGTRWAPFPPSFTHLPHPERDQAREDWYLEVYWPWKRAVAEAIDADPAGARANFTAAYPNAWTEMHARHQAAIERRQQYEAIEAQRRRYSELTAALFADCGMSTRAIAKSQGCAWDTAQTRIAAGRAAWAADPAGSRQLLAEHFGDLGPTVDVDALLERLGAPVAETSQPGTSPPPQPSANP